MKVLKQNFGSIITCLCEIVVGILLLMDPIHFTSAIIVGVGVVLMVMGVISIVRYFRAEPAAAAKSYGMVKGLVFLVVGAFCVFQYQWFIVTFPVISILYGVIILLIGLIKIQWMVDAIRLKREKWVFAAVSALLSIVCGIIIIANPFTSTTVLWIFIGICLIAEAVLDILDLFLGHKKQASPVVNKVSSAEPENASHTDANVTADVVKKTE